MTFPKILALCCIAMMATAVSSAQQKFPLRSGEWTETSSTINPATGKPISMLFCMNDETWAKALSGNPSCAMKNLSLTPFGATYSVDCTTPKMQMNGDFKVVFDGTTHMTSSGSMSISFNGKTNQMNSTADFRWKGPVCDPNADANLRNHSVPSPSH